MEDIYDKSSKEDLKGLLRLSHMIRVNLVSDLTEAFVAKYGEEARDVVAQVFIDANCKMVDRLAPKFEKNARGAADMLSAMLNNVGTIGEIVESRPERSVRRKWRCLFQNLWDFEMYKKVSPPMLDYLCKALNPKLVAHNPKYMTRGDECCEVIFELKEEKA